jgi:hypothetical protein
MMIGFGSLAPGFSVALLAVQHVLRVALHAGKPAVV